MPVLWDKKENDRLERSSEIIRMFNSAFDRIGAKPGDYYPEELPRRDRRCERARLSHGEQRRVPKRFARSQEAYDEAFTKLFDRSIGWKTGYPASVI